MAGRRGGNVNGSTAGTAPARLDSTGNMAVPTMWNGDTSVAAAVTIDTGGRVGIGFPRLHRWPVQTSERATDTPSADTLAAETPDAVSIIQPHLHDVFERLIALAGLPRDWDRQGAEPVDEGVIARAIATLRYLIEQSASAGFLLPRPAVGPSPGGSIGFEWEHGADVLTIECARGTDSLAVYRSCEGEEIEQDIDSMPALWDAVRDFLRLIA